MASSTAHNGVEPAASINDDTMTGGQATSPAAGGSSDGEGGERTAREKLKKTSIAGLAQQGRAAGGRPLSGEYPSERPPSIGNETQRYPSTGPSNGIRGRPAKKRSFEDLAEGDSTVGIENGVAGPPLPKSGHHKRMRSRDVTAGEHVPALGKYENEVGSPVQEESDAEAQKSPGGPGILIDVPLKDLKEAVDASKEQITTDRVSHTEALAGTDDSSRSNGAKPDAQPSTSTTTPAANSSSADPPTAQLKPSSGFANASSTSPFGRFTSPSKSKSPDPTTATEPSSTSTSAFASSGLSAFASSEKSPFGAMASSSQSGGGFGGATTKGGFGSTSGGFGSAAKPAPFGMKSTSGFGGSSGGFGSTTGFGGGFGATKPFGSGLSSFASPAGTGAAFAPAKPFGTSKDEDDEDGSEGGDERGNADEDEENKADTRFHEQDLETGEEEERTIFSCRAKLYHFEKEWKERGVGTFKINVRYESTDNNEDDDDEERRDDPEAPPPPPTERKARLLMRTDGVHRVILNTPVFKGMHVGTQDGDAPTGKTMHLTGLENGQPRGFQIKIGKEDVLRDLYHKIVELKAELA